MATSPVSGQARRFTAAALIAVVVALSVWLFGRPEPETTVQVVAAAEDWPAGREPGEYVIVEMPEESAALFVTAGQLADRVPVVAVPAGTVVSAALMAGSAVPAASDLSAALLAVTVDSSLWPEPGPRAGDAAVLGPTVWWIWESPPAGWPGCPPAPAPLDEGRSENADDLN